ncbi:MAG: homospermidine synthase, partial [Ketobacter sp.]
MLISLFFFGNPDRGDDAAGETLYRWAQDYFSDHSRLADGLELRLTYDFQLEPEHIFDLDGSDLGIFID